MPAEGDIAHRGSQPQRLRAADRRRENAGEEAVIDHEDFVGLAMRQRSNGVQAIWIRFFGDIFDKVDRGEVVFEIGFPCRKRLIGK